MKANKITVRSIDEQNGIVVLVPRKGVVVKDNHTQKIALNGRVYKGHFKDGQCWIRTGSAFPETYSLSY
ncbi:hypothetical protein [Larkinella sp. C7]|uniref:hypothetical protein n=1 Tax=Larkinella sp. C7 TaxID=2576607 RepID=UPI00111160BB|nr:hypothetical protein [Larkinella sp. C7]